MLIKSTFFSICTLVAIAGLAGCAGSGTSKTVVIPPGSASVRYVDSMTSPSVVKFAVDGTTTAGAATYGSVSAFSAVTSGNRTITTADAATNAALGSVNIGVLTGISYSIVGFNVGSTGQILVLTGGTPVPTDQTAVRYAKVGGSNSGPDDIYITVPGADISAISPSFSGVTMGDGPQGYAFLPPGMHEFRQTASGSKTVVTDQQINLVAGGAATVLNQGGSTFLVLRD